MYRNARTSNISCKPRATTGSSTPHRLFFLTKKKRSFCGASKKHQPHHSSSLLDHTHTLSRASLVCLHEDQYDTTTMRNQRFFASTLFLLWLTCVYSSQTTNDNVRRRLSFPEIAGYEPASIVTDVVRSCYMSLSLS